MKPQTKAMLEAARAAVQRKQAQTGGGIRFSPPDLQGGELEEWMDRTRKAGLFPIRRDPEHEGI